MVNQSFKTVAGIADDPAPDVLVKDLLDTGIKLEVRFWSNPRSHDQPLMCSDLTMAILSAFETAGIEFASQSHNILIDNSPVPTSKIEPRKTAFPFGNTKP